MKVDHWLDSASRTLETAGIGSARLDCLILLEDELKKDRSWILAHPETILQNSAVRNLNKKLALRKKHEPLAYIRGFTEFHSRKFQVDKSVLEPRPESETMIELLKQLVDSGKLLVNSGTTIADIGTGSGALAITAKLEFPVAKVIATDIDKACLIVARKNAKSLKAAIEFVHGDLLQPLSTSISTVLANLPYVPDHYHINEAAAMEPAIAIFGGPDGLDLYRKMFAQIGSMENKPRHILTESLPPQHKKLKEIAENSGYILLDSCDLIQIFYLAD